ncbi:MAG: ABC transporter permease, partial [Acidobacteria bacterium]|nr:ABC transporter permease [Acidobacteriota bacterium]
MNPSRPRASSGVAGLSILAGLILMGAAAPWLAGAPHLIVAEALQPPSSAHPFGTDDLGRDLLAAVLHGTRTSMAVGLAAAVLSGSLGLMIGGVAGRRAGAVDHALMRFTDLIQALPRFFLIVMVVSLFGSQLSLVVLVIGLTAWPPTARLFRAQVQGVFTREFALASRAAGAGDTAILVRHAWPVARPVVAAQISFQAGGAILAEAGLSFLGLGDPAVVSWGSLLGSAQHFVREAWWMSVFPGAAITLTVLACNLLADALVRRQ